VKSKFIIDEANLVLGFYITNDFNKSVNYYISFQNPEPENVDKGTLLLSYLSARVYANVLLYYYCFCF